MAFGQPAPRPPAGPADPSGAEECLDVLATNGLDADRHAVLLEERDHSVELIEVDRVVDFARVACGCSL
jgi:hypothetical protein